MMNTRVLGRPERWILCKPCPHTARRGHRTTVLSYKCTITAVCSRTNVLLFPGQGFADGGTAESVWIPQPNNCASTPGCAAGNFLKNFEKSVDNGLPVWYSNHAERLTRSPSLHAPSVLTDSNARLIAGGM